ncbi:Septal ring factor EnvC, activator of murein hydrolases AmiA and AmiB [Deinococcus reticulitermitis]|uniref:Septal ring factor EnvC, activator of murein hydrolases AmiA and AmiB n=1 Tax=Deinococcus reticulitermitis TaxID=856736 RepID=A0A1H6S5V7_9DEIO|nr:M23 family metallopeptidase [Deinococcus reticulitermitis]SEI62116.1 Septal ring factor EnvC, activator of murein hydrolases AmiA and AmiB [Deinococcus reticulitermitis]
MRGARWPGGVLLTAALLSGLGGLGGPGAGWLRAQAQQRPAALPQSGTELTSQKLEQLERDLAEQRRLSQAQAERLRALRAQLGQLSVRQRAAIDRLDRLAAETGKLENELADVIRRVTGAQARLRATKADLAVTQARVDTLKTDVRAMLRSLHRERDAHYLRLLSQSGSLWDLLIRLDYANMAGERNVQVTRELRGAATELTAQRAAQEVQAEELRGLQGEQQAKLAELRARRAAQAAELAELKRTAEGQQAFAARTQAQQALTAQTIDALVTGVVKEKTRLEEERRRRLEEERRRREAEARRIREAQERARREAERLARIRAEQERRAREAEARRQAELTRQAEVARQAELTRQAELAREAAAARRRAEAQAAAQREREAAVARERQALAERQAQTEQAQAQLNVELQPLPATTDGEAMGFPLPGGQVSAPFGTGGEQWAVISGPVGGQAVAARGGNVLAAAYYAALGWVILIDHGNNLITGYFGLQDSLVSAGQRVNQGTPLGVIGGSHILGTDRMAFQVRDGVTPVPPQF